MPRIVAPISSSSLYAGTTTATRLPSSIRRRTLQARAAGEHAAASRYRPRVNEHLMHALLYAALFLETSTEDECDPDLAVKELEGIAWSLRQLSAAEQEEFRAFARREADRHPVREVAAEIAALVEGL